ncbi:phasin family protein [Pseudomonas sp. Marseille-QA0892]
MSERNEAGRDNSWMAELERQARQLKLAGLGAYSRFSKDGAKLFESLVQDGEEAEQARQQGRHAEDRGDERARHGARERFDQARERAAGRWSELEEMFDRRLGSTLDRLGVPTRHEVDALRAEVNALKARVDQLESTQAAAASPIVDPTQPEPAAPGGDTIILPDSNKPPL